MMAICSKCKEEFSSPPYPEIYCKKCRAAAQRRYFKRERWRALKVKQIDIPTCRRIFDNPSTLEELKKSYRKLMLYYHPDRDGNPHICSILTKMYDWYSKVIGDENA